MHVIQEMIASKSVARTDQNNMHTKKTVFEVRQYTDLNFGHLASSQPYGGI